MTPTKTESQTKPRMSDDAVEAKTGKTWSYWFRLLDKAGAKKMNHQEIVAVVGAQHESSRTRKRAKS